MESCVENLKKQLQCSCCNDTLVEPKLVDCFHVFCKLCIKRNSTEVLAEVDRQEYIFKCPQCDSTTLLQDLNDVEDLQSSPVHSRILKVLEFVENQKFCSVSSSHPEASWQCLDCDKSMCEECLRYHSEFIKHHQVVSLSDLKKEDVDQLLKKEPLCKTHNNENVELQCQDCDMLICLLCWKQGHQNHKTIAMQDIIAIETDSLSKNLEQIHRMNANEHEKKQQEEIALIIKRDGEKAKQQVKKLTDNLVQALKNSERQLLNEIQESITKAEGNLRIISHTTQAQEYVKYFIDNGTASEMIDARHNKSSQNLTYDPFDITIGGIEFNTNETLCEQVKRGLGLLRSINEVADSQMSSIKVIPSDLEATKKAKLVVELKTSKRKVAKEHLENVCVKFTPQYNVKVEEMQMADDGEITVDFIPRVPGQLTVDVKLHGNPVCNSPLVMVVKPEQIREMTGHSKLKDALNTGSQNFTGIAVNPTHSKIAVADNQSHCVRVYNMEGDLLLTYGSKGSVQGQFDCPRGLSFLNETDLVIADFGNHRISIVNTTTGQLVRTFGCYGNGNGKFEDPCGVHVDDDENIIVCDNGNKRVQVFTKAGDYLYQFSVLGHPRGVVKHNGLFYVSDGSVVHVIEMKENQSPTTVTTIGGEDYTDGQLRCPWGLAIDNNDNILICDCDAYLIYKFTLDGRYVGQSGKLFVTNKPRYIAVLNDGQVICTTLVVKTMLDPKHSEALRKKIDDKATHKIRYYGPINFVTAVTSGTTHLSIIDKEGNGVSLTSSINKYFGAKIRSKKYGIIFNDQLADAMNLWVNEYGLIPDSFKSHRKPLSLATPAMVLDKDDNLQMVIGAAGSRYIPTTLAQVFMNYYWFSKSLKDVVAEPRLHSQHFPDMVLVEENFDGKLIKEIKKFGHRYVTNDTALFTGTPAQIIGVVQLIVRKKNGELLALADYRKGGIAAGYKK